MCVLRSKGPWLLTYNHQTVISLSFSPDGSLCQVRKKFLKAFWDITFTWMGHTDGQVDRQPKSMMPPVTAISSQMHINEQTQSKVIIPAVHRSPLNPTTVYFGTTVNQIFSFHITDIHMFIQWNMTIVESVSDMPSPSLPRRREDNLRSCRSIGSISQSARHCLMCTWC